MTRSASSSDASSRTATTASTDEPHDFCLVPAGSFIYGPEQCYERLEQCPPRRPRQMIDLPAFAIGRSPVTNRQWLAFLRATGFAWQGRWYEVVRGWRGTWQRAYRPTGDYPARHAGWPVVEVSQSDAHAYCTWLSDRLGLPCTLPTEEEWEKAARGTDGRRFPWGDTPPRPEIQWQRPFPVGLASYACSLVVPARREWARAGWYWRNGYPREVGHDPRNVSPYGCLDMSGNVWEWTSSLYNPDLAGFHVVKGGSWGYSVHHAAANARSACSVTVPSADYRAAGTGFRIRTAPDAALADG